MTRLRATASGGTGECCWLAVVVTATERVWLPEGPPGIANRAAALPPPGGTACGVGAHRRWPMFRIGGRQTGALAMRCDKSTEMSKGTLILSATVCQCVF